MEILALPLYGQLGASSRLRFYQFLPHFESRGISARVSCLLDDDLLRIRYLSGGYSQYRVALNYLARLRVLCSEDPWDLTWVEKEAFPWLSARCERAVLARRPYVLDYDDATFHIYDRHRSRAIRGVLGRRIDTLMAGSRLVLAGNDYLADRARAAGAQWVEIAPTVLDVGRYRVRLHEERQVPILVWIGSPSSVIYLRELADPLSRLFDLHPFRLRVIGSHGPVHVNVPVEYVTWTEDSEAISLSECDIGIMPLVEDPWALGKCGYKLVQYMAAGLPTVASDVGANKRIVVEGVTGYLARTERDWVESLLVLLCDASLRSAFGSAGRARVEKMYSLEVFAPKFLSLLQHASV